jgi:hypothetical protein
VTKLFCLKLRLPLESVGRRVNQLLVTICVLML